MQKFWQQESGRRAGLTLLLSFALTVLLLTGSAYGSGLVGASPVVTDGPTPSASLILASLPQDNDLSPRPPRKPERAPKRPDVVALLNFGTFGPKQVALPDFPRPARKPGRTPDTPLQTTDAALYKTIFDHQNAGRWSAADKLLPQLTEDHLRGHVLYQRYMHPSYKSGFGELQAWLDKYADLPGADRIYRLAESRRGILDKAALRKPGTRKGLSTGTLALLDDSSATYTAAHKRSSAQQQEIKTLLRTIRADISKGEPGKALRHYESAPARKYLDEVENDQIRAQIAAGYLNDGKIKKAYDLASAAAKRSGTNVPVAGWTAGLAAWRLKKYKDAAPMFELVATSPFTSSWMSAGGAYWASRAHMRSGKTREVSQWLRLAAAHPRTFYGLIATRALGWDFDFNWHMPAPDKAQMALLNTVPAARRAMALVAANQHHLAEDELRSVNPGKDADLRQALLAYAHHARLPAVAMRLAESTAAPGGALYDAALYPLVPWEPNGGFAIDRALIHAFVRQESRFDANAQNNSGATGLMQLMPATARYVAGDTKLKGKDGTYSLRDPETNLTIGQRYIADLLAQKPVADDLFSLAIAYNAGPGNLRKWKERLKDTKDDPLLFVESIPVGETRAFVERVLANYWIYALRMEQDTPSLDAVAAGNEARYVALDKPARKAFRIASN
jgi:soluble lytic murein transglycosylase-like protein